MARQIIAIDRDLCSGCGLCVDACQEGAIGLVDGKAMLLREDHCDGLGNCLPGCPTGAISFTMVETPAVSQTEFVCPGSQARTFAPPKQEQESSTAPVASQLRQWPVQLKLVAPNAGFLNNSDLLIAADCAAYAHGSFHDTFIRDRVVLIGCPKLDSGDYAEKLGQILANHTIRSITVTRMEVPCCGGLDHAVKRAIEASGKIIPLAVVTITTDGDILR